MIMIAKATDSQQVLNVVLVWWFFYLEVLVDQLQFWPRTPLKKLKCLSILNLYGGNLEIEVENFPAFILVDDKGMISLRN